MISVRHTGPITTVLLDRPDRRNALTPEMLADLGALSQSLPSSTRAVVLAGDGRVFCSGFDLDLCHAEPDGSAMRALLTGLYEAISALRALPVPVVAAVQGAAIAGGCALLGGADFVISHAEAKFGYPVLALGVSPGVSAPFLRNALGDGAARERLLDTGLVSGIDAQRLGLVYQTVHTPDQVRPRALELASELAAKPAGAVHATRAWLRDLEDGSSRRPAAAALGVSLSLAGGPEEKERLAAIAPRR